MEKKEEILRVRNLDISFETTAGVVNAERSTADRSHFHIIVTRRNGSPEKFCR